MGIADTEMFLYLGGTCIRGQWFLASGSPLEQNSLRSKVLRHSKPNLTEVFARYSSRTAGSCY